MNKTIVLASPVWDIDLTKELVGKMYDSDQLAKLSPVMRAVNIRLFHAQIHHADYQRLVESHLAKPMEDGATIFDLMFGSDDDTVGASNLFFITCEAHLYACVQAMHAIADNLAHVAYYVLGWNFDEQFKPKSVSVHTVLKRLRGTESSSAIFVPVRKVFEDLVAQSQYIILSNIVNHLKHHGGMHVAVSWGSSEDEPFRVLMSSFFQNETAHPQREISTYLKNTYDTMNQAVVHVGCALNEYLCKKS